MPDKTSPTADPPSASSSRFRLVLVGVLCLGLAGAGYFVGMRGSGGAAAGTLVPEPEPTVALVVDLPPINVNLADGHYLRIAVSLGLSEEAAPAEGGVDEFPTAPASDVVLTTFTGRSMADLQEAAGRDDARRALSDGIRAYYGDVLVDVFFTEFVMQ